MNTILKDINLLPVIFGYAEIHYRLKYLKPRYYRKLPEIIADVPSRIVKNITNKIPILIIVKDADLFPIILENVFVEILTAEKEIRKNFAFGKKIAVAYYSQILEIDLKDISTEQVLSVKVNFEISEHGKKYTFTNDNYYGIKSDFRCYYSENGLPYPQNWFAGEPHFHSNFTADQVEFGSDIVATKKLAKAMGLKWFFVTDHSYDLDDAETNYLKNDKNLPKWEKMLAEAKQSDEEDFRVLAGEEVSIGNDKKKNVHLLIVNQPEFIFGDGDSAEKWFHNKPHNYLAQLSEIVGNSGVLTIAAHPQEKVPFLQKILLRRGNWSEIDYRRSGIRFLQIVNNSEMSEITKAIIYWKNLLLKGYKFFILAGNDAHGNFNVMRQIKIPFWKLFTSHKQIFGKFQTVFHFPQNDPINGLQNGEIIIGNGPFLNFGIKIKETVFPIGSTVNGESGKLFFETETTPEFGEIRKMDLFVGDYRNKTEKQISQVVNGMELTFPRNGYLRMSLETSRNGVVFTNPIWIENSIK